MTRKRADLLLVERGFADSREQAKNLIDEGKVQADGRPVEKAGTLLDTTCLIELESRPPYVSRGGLKLEEAIRRFGIDVVGQDALDAGVGTGGFTDCLLKHGANRVIAVDVGYGQVAWGIRSDHRVTLVERTNIRHLDPAELPFKVDIVTVDLSFISVRKVIDVLLSLAKAHAEFIILVKPQFEAGRELVGKKGIIRDARVHRMVLTEFVGFLQSKGMDIQGVAFSPIKGGKGNLEFLVYAVADGVKTPVDWSGKIENVVKRAHRELSDERA